MDPLLDGINNILGLFRVTFVLLVIKENLNRHMIKIIENPNPVKEEIRICENCKCKFSYTKADVNSQ